MKHLLLNFLVVLMSVGRLFGVTGELQIEVTNCNETTAITINITKVADTDVYDDQFNRTTTEFQSVELEGDGPGLYECDFLTGQQSGNGQLGYGIYQINVEGKQSRNVKVDYRDCKYPYSRDDFPFPIPITADILLYYDWGENSYSWSAPDPPYEHTIENANNETITVWENSDIATPDWSCFPPFQYMYYTNIKGGVDVGGSFLINGEDIVDSGDEVPFEDGLTVLTALLNQSYSHHDWENNQEDYVREYVPEYYHGETYEAFYKDTEAVEVISDYNVPILFHDPWFISNPTDSAKYWIQPDELLSTSAMKAVGDLRVFKNDNPGFSSSLPRYKVSAPEYLIRNDTLFYFQGWDGTNAEFDINHSTSTTSNETYVLFTAGQSSVTANYIPANYTSNTEIYIEDEEQLIIPAGTELDFATGVQINVYDGDLIVEGTKENPVRLYSTPGAWKGIYSYSSTSTISMEHVTIEDATSAVHDYSSIYLTGASSEISNSTFKNCGSIRTWGEADLSYNVLISDGSYSIPAIRVENASIARIHDNTFINYCKSY